MRNIKTFAGLSENEPPTPPAKEDSLFNPLHCPICLEMPARLSTFSAWVEHTPFAMYLVQALKPRIIVELGTHYGDSYCAFCQAVKHLNLDTHCYAIDTWTGDQHSGLYGPEVLANLRAHHDPLYGGFSFLLQTTFDDALSRFDDGSIDLLHIDGCHAYDAVKKDFESWRAKVSSRGVVLFHDTNVRERGFGVWKYWEELSTQYAHFEFLHGHGLGVLAMGQVNSPNLESLLGASEKERSRIRQFFHALGQKASLAAESLAKDRRLAEVCQQVGQKEQELRQREVAMAETAIQLRHLSAQVSEGHEALEQLGRRHRQEMQRLAWRVAEQSSAFESLESLLKEEQLDIRRLPRRFRNGGLAAIRQSRNHDGPRKARIKLLKTAENHLPGSSRGRIQEPDHIIRPLAEAPDAPPLPEAIPDHSEVIALAEALSERIQGALDEPVDNSSISTTFEVIGWALSRAQVATVEVFLDGNLIERVKYGAARPDVANVFPQYNQVNCGYAGRVRVGDELADDLPHSLLVRVRDIQGRLIEHHRSVRLHRDPYQFWIRNNEPDELELAAQREKAGRLPYRPLISIITPVYNTPPDVLRAMLDSVLAQTYDHWQLCLADGGSTDPAVRAVLEEYVRRDARIRIKLLPHNLGISGNSNEALALASGEFIALLDHDDELAPNALYENALLINHHPDADMIYSDEDKLDECGHRLGPPFCKPDWSPDLFRSMMYICHLGVYRSELVKQLGGFRPEFDGAQDYDLVLRLIEHTSRIHHIPLVLYHWRVGAGSVAGNADAKPYAYSAQVRAIAEHCQRLGWDCTVEAGLHRGHNRIRHTLRTPPRVSIIIITRNHGRLLRRCVESICARSTYSNYEIIVVDNGSTDAATRDYLQTLAGRAGMRVLAHPGDRNHAALNNFAAAQAGGDLLLLLDSHLEVLTHDWLEAMVGHAMREDVGAVGAKLVSADGGLQHGGFILIPGRVALAMHQGLPPENHGYYGLIRVLRNVSAVTAACLLTRHALFQAVGGLDEHNLGTAFHDVDYCLRLREEGRLTLWTPFAELLRHDANDQQGDDAAADLYELRHRAASYMQRRWHEVIKQDPYYSPNLALESGDFSLAHLSRYKPYAVKSR
jgi:O-antigen biosynthesis protein